MDFRQVFARHVQAPRMFHCTDCEEYRASAIRFFFFGRLKRATASAHDETFGNVPRHVYNFFAGVDAQIIVEHEMNVMRKKLFPRRLLANRLQRAFAHFEFVRRREHCAADGILPNRVGDRSLLDDNVRQTFARRCVRSRQAGRPGADDQKVESFAQLLTLRRSGIFIVREVIFITHAIERRNAARLRKNI